MWLSGKGARIKIGNKLLYESHSTSIDVFMLVFLFMLMFRGVQCGIDTIQYMYLFEKYSSADIYTLLWTGSHEMGYKLLNKLVGMTGASYQVLLATTSVISVIPIWYCYKRESSVPLLTISLFLSVTPFCLFFSGIRQAIAISCGVVAWYVVKKKKLWLFIVIVVLAMQFHVSAFMLLALYPLYYARITKKWLWFVVPIMLVIYFLRNAIFSFLFSLLWKDYQEGSETGAVNILILLILFAVYSYIIVDEKSLDQDTIALRNILLLSIVIQIFAMLHPLSMRMNYYFLIFVPILIPKIVKHSSKRYADVAKLSVIVMTIYFMYYFVNCILVDNDPLNVFPYIPFWENGQLV